jgi:hypothetical protein
MAEDDKIEAANETVDNAERSQQENAKLAEQPAPAQNEPAGGWGLSNPFAPAQAQRPPEPPIPFVGNWSSKAPEVEAPASAELGLSNSFAPAQDTTQAQRPTEPFNPLVRPVAAEPAPASPTAAPAENGPSQFAAARDTIASTITSAMTDLKEGIDAVAKNNPDTVAAINDVVEKVKAAAEARDAVAAGLADLQKGVNDVIANSAPTIDALKGGLAAMQEKAREIQAQNAALEEGPVGERAAYEAGLAQVEAEKAQPKAAPAQTASVTYVAAGGDGVNYNTTTGETPDAGAKAPAVDSVVRTIPGTPAEQQLASAAPAAPAAPALAPNAVAASAGEAIPAAPIFKDSVTESNIGVGGTTGTKPDTDRFGSPSAPEDKQTELLQKMHATMKAASEDPDNPEKLATFNAAYKDAWAAFKDSREADGKMSADESKDFRAAYEKANGNGTGQQAVDMYNKITTEAYSDLANVAEHAKSKDGVKDTVQDYLGALDQDSDGKIDAGKEAKLMAALEKNGVTGKAAEEKMAFIKDALKDFNRGDIGGPAPASLAENLAPAQVGGAGQAAPLESRQF